MEFNFLKDKLTILDCAMGTVLQQKGSPAWARSCSIYASGAYRGRAPFLYPRRQPGHIHQHLRREPNEAGAYRAQPRRGHSRGRRRGQKGRRGTGAAVALDVGPLGALLEPLGSLSFEKAYGLFREMTEAGQTAGADLIVIETATDLYEAKAALLAAKESTDLPVFVTMSFEERGRTFTGCTAASMARTLEGLGADAIGLELLPGTGQTGPAYQGDM